MIKLGHIPKLDFFKEHINVINMYGYVDFARIGKCKIPISNYKTIVFKESKYDGNRIFIAKTTIGDSERRHYPEYYKDFDLSEATWIRLVDLQEMQYSEFVDSYTNRAGGSVESLFKSMVPIAYIKRK